MEPPLSYAWYATTTTDKDTVTIWAEQGPWRPLNDIYDVPGKPGARDIGWHFQNGLLFIGGTNPDGWYHLRSMDVPDFMDPLASFELRVPDQKLSYLEENRRLISSYW